MRTSFTEEILSKEVQGDKSSLAGQGKTGRGWERWGRVALLKKIIAFSVILICFFFLGITLYHNLGEISAYQWNLKLSSLILSFFFLIANLSISAFAWKRVLLLFGARLPFLQSFKIMFVSGLGRYLPGKIWPYLGQVYLSGKAEIPRSVTLFSVLLLFGISSLVGVLAFIFSLFFWGRLSPMTVSFLLLTFSVLILIILSPRVLNRMLRTVAFIFNRLRGGIIPQELTLRGGIRNTGEIILIFMANWIVFGFAVHSLINSFHNLDIPQTVILCGIFAISVIAGIVSFFVPAGLGVREGILSYLLSLFMPLSTAVLISLVMRVWTTLGELVCFFVALKIKKPKLL